MTRVRGLVIPALVLLLWELAPRFGLVDAGLLPPPSRVLGAGLALMGSGALWAHLAASLWRVGLGYALAVMFALPLGLALGLNPALDSYLNPLLQALRPIAPPAWVPLAILWLGIGDPPAVFVIFVGTVLAVMVGTAAAARALERELVEVALTLGATRWQAVRWVALPALAPALFGQLRVGLGLAWMCVVAAEMVAVRSGLGFMLMEARSLFHTERVLLCMAVIGALGLGLDRLLLVLERRMLRWREGTEAHELLAIRRL